MSPVIKNIDSTAADEVPAVKYSLAHINIMRDFVCDIVYAPKRKKKISLGKVWSHFTHKQHFSLASSFFAAASENLFFDGESTNMRRLPRLNEYIL